MKVSLIIAPSWSVIKPPISLALLASNLRRYGHKVYAIDLNNQLYLACNENYKDKWNPENDLYWKQPSFVSIFVKEYRRIIDSYIEQVLESGSEMIGFSVYFTNQLMSLELSRLIKEKAKEKIIVFGGPQCMPYAGGSEILKDKSVDGIVINEGDQTIVELANMLEDKGYFSFCPGVLYKKEGDLIDCGHRAPITDLDSLPFADFRDFVPERYLNPTELPFLASRGCKWNCLFCTAKMPWQIYRSQSGERIFAEVKYQITENPNINVITFHDCMINGNIEALERFCDLIIEEKKIGKLQNLSWWGQGIIREEMSRQLLQKMKVAGCRKLTYGVESGSDKVTHLMGKKFKADTASRVIKDTHESGILATVIFMFGFPGEQEDDFKETLRFLEKNREYIDETIPAEGFCVIERHSPLYKNAERMGIYLNPHPSFWRSRDGKNTYLDRYRRFEAFCDKANSLNVKLVGSFGKNKTLKETLVKEYYDCVDKVRFNICAGMLEKQNGNSVVFIWEITRRCGLTCPYCKDKLELLGGAGDIHLSPQEWEEVWVRIYKDYGEVEINITGGEPSIYPGFFELVKRISRFHCLRISTNLSGRVEEFKSEFDSARVRFNLNFHPMNLNLEEFLRKATILKEGNFSVKTYCLAYPTYINQISFLVRRFAAFGLELNINAFLGKYNSKIYPDGYTEEELGILQPYLGDRQRISYNLKGESPKGKLCNAGYKRVVIGNNADVMRCYYAPEEVLGALTDPGFRLFNKPKVCDKDFCPYNEFDNVF